MSNQTNQIANNNLLTDAVVKIKTLMLKARRTILKYFNKKALKSYWQIGQIIIIEKEQDGKLKSRHGEKLLIELSKELTRQMGRGFSRSNLANMRLILHNLPNYPVSDWTINLDTLLRITYTKR